MAKSWMSFKGLYTWDSHLFDDLALPDGVIKDILIDTLLIESSELEVLYPVPDVMRRALGVFSKARSYKWNTAYNTTKFEYNPIENYDRMETTTREYEHNNKNTTTDTQTTTNKQTGSETVAISKYAFDSNTATPTDNNLRTPNLNTDVDYSETLGAENSEKHTENINTRAHGNIGVTTSQQMLQSERDVADFDIYNYIVKDIITHLTVEVY